MSEWLPALLAPVVKQEAFSWLFFGAPFTSSLRKLFCSNRFPVNVGHLSVLRSPPSKYPRAVLIRVVPASIPSCPELFRVFIVPVLSGSIFAFDQFSPQTFGDCFFR